MTQRYEPTAPIVHGLPNEDYRSAKGDSATLLKGCLRSPLHALAPKPRTKTLDQGLRLHEFILERDKFLSSYVSGLNPEEYPDALHTAEHLKLAAKALNETRKPKLKTTGTAEVLLQQLAEDDPEHLAHVDVSSLSKTDLINKIKHINEQPNRGIIALSGSSLDLYERMRSAGWGGEYYPALVKQHALKQPEAVSVLPYDEYTGYEQMYQSLLNHVQIGAQIEQEEGSGVIMQWLLYALTNQGSLETEVSMFGEKDKCRMDAMLTDGSSWVAFDLKRTQDASDEGFGKQCARYHYDLQAAHYSEVSKEVGRPIATFGFIAIEPEPPYAVNIFVPDAKFYESGNKKRNYAKKQLAEFKEKEYNTAYEPRPKTVSLPAWNDYGPWAE